MTVQDIINDVRPKLSDTVEPYQFLPSPFYQAINESIRKLAAATPAALYVSQVTTDLPDDVDALSDTVEIHDNYRTHLVDLVVHELLIQDKRNRAAQTPPEETATP